MSTIAETTEPLNSAHSTTVQGATAIAVALGALALWHAVDLDVSAVIGRRGAGAVLRQALVATRRVHAWIPEPQEDASFDICVRALSTALAGRTMEEAAAGGSSLEATFHDLLSSLVGAALTTQLLRAAWALRRAPVRSLP